MDRQLNLSLNLSSACTYMKVAHAVRIKSMVCGRKYKKSNILTILILSNQVDKVKLNVLLQFCSSDVFQKDGREILLQPKRKMM